MNPASLPLPLDLDFETLLEDGAENVGLEGLGLDFEVDVDAEGRGGLNGFGGILLITVYVCVL